MKDVSRDMFAPAARNAAPDGGEVVRQSLS
jgi:hypothetical protein